MYKTLALFFRPPDGEFRNRFTPQKGSKKNKLEYDVHPFDQTMIHPSMYQTGARYNIRIILVHCHFVSRDKTYCIAVASHAKKMKSSGIGFQCLMSLFRLTNCSCSCVSEHFAVLQLLWC